MFAVSRNFWQQGRQNDENGPSKGPLFQEAPPEKALAQQNISPQAGPISVARVGALAKNAVKLASTQD